MTEQPSTLAPFYKGWDAYQQLLVNAIAPLSDEQLELRPGGDLRSVRMIALHIIGARARWLHYVLHESGDNLVALGSWDRPGEPARSAAEIVGALESTWQVLQAGLQRWTPADLEEVLQETFDEGEQGEPESFSRQWVIWHLIEHDLHHGGELSFLLGMHNVPAIDL
ncbi:MAG TPA: DinB family protein [Herpetosiphonaceae bacterium]